MDLKLKDRVAVVCGASGGLGRAVAAALAREGAKCVIASSDTGRIENAAEEIRTDSGAEVLAVAADFGKKADIERLVKAAVERFGGIDVLFTNTGGPPPGFFDEFDDKAWSAAFESQLMFIVRTLRLVIPEMKKRGGGRIINSTSLSVKEPIDNLLLSNVFRSGVVALSKTLSRELAPHNILINCVAPGYTRTDRLADLFGVRARAAGKTPEEIEKEITSRIPLGRIPDPEEFAEVVAFLAGAGASAVTGTTLAVDGGVLRGIL